MIVSGMLRSPEGGGAIAATCYAPSDVTPQELQNSLSASQNNPAWKTVLSRLSRKEAVSRAELDRPLSPEAREFLYELVPSAVATPTESADRVVTRFANEDAPVPAMLMSMQSDEVTIRCTAMSVRSEADFSSTAQSMYDVTCSCQLWMNELVARDDGEILGRWYTWTCELHFGGAAPSSQPGYDEPPMPSGLPAEIDAGGYTAPDPTECEGGDDPPDDEIPEDSLGRQYFRALTECADSSDTEIPPTPVPCPSGKECNRPLSVSDSAILRRAITSPLRDSTAFTDPRAWAYCSYLKERLNTVWQRPDFWYRGNDSIPGTPVENHVAAYQAGWGIHVDTDFLRDANVTPAEMLSILLHEIAHVDNYQHPSGADPTTGIYVDEPFNWTTYRVPNSCVP
jgi:hypothetical protein